MLELTAPPAGVSEWESKAWCRWLRSERTLVEPVFAMLSDLFRAEAARARSLIGVQTRDRSAPGRAVFQSGRGHVPRQRIALAEARFLRFGHPHRDVRRVGTLR